MSGFLKNIYAFINLGMAGFVMATVAVRFAFPAVSAEGASFWIIRTSPITLHDFLWSKFWTAFVPVLLLTEVLTVAANEFLGVDPFLKVVTALAIVLMTFALVGLAVGLGARYPRFGADPSQVAGSYGGVAFMMQAVLFVIVMIGLLGWPSSVYLLQQVRGRPLSASQLSLIALLLRRRDRSQHRDLARLDAIGRPRAARAWATSRRGRNHPRITGWRGLREQARSEQRTCGSRRPAARRSRAG